jgi:hypothetical protein
VQKRTSPGGIISIHKSLQSSLESESKLIHYCIAFLAGAEDCIAKEADYNTAGGVIVDGNVEAECVRDYRVRAGAQGGCAPMELF